MNWGNKLLITFAVFGTMMSYLVYRAVTTNFELVEKEYYKSELNYQQVIDGNALANTLTHSPIVAQKEEIVYIEMPQEMNGKITTGNVWFYCAYDLRNDRKLPLEVNKDGIQVMPIKINPGNYTAKISWTAEGKQYYSEKNISIQ